MIEISTARDMEELGAAVAGCVIPGDVICLSGALGAGKTTLVRGLARGLGVTDQVSSPTFVIARRHRGSRSDLVHCDAYRVGDEEEFEDLGLDPRGAVVVLEWGSGYAELLADDWLQIEIERTTGIGDDLRRVTLLGNGPRWSDDALRALRAAVRGAVPDPPDPPDAPGAPDVPDTAGGQR